MNVTLILFSVILCVVSVRVIAEDNKVIDVWPAEAPGEKGDIGPEHFEPTKPTENPTIPRLTNVTKPTLTVYAPPKDKNTGASVVICPGGGYGILAIGHEGEDVAKWLNTIGMTGIVLKYRVPARKGQPKHLAPVQDAQRAMSVVRSKAKELEIDPAKIGLLGFSAGGNLTAIASTNFDERMYPVIDDTDKVSCRPDFSVLVYPAWLVDAKTNALIPEVKVTPQTPPAIFIHAGDDKIGAESSILMSLALRHEKVPTELHVFTDGGHGFGMKHTGKPIESWTKLCEVWFRTMKFIPAAAKE